MFLMHFARGVATAACVLTLSSTIAGAQKTPTKAQRDSIARANSSGHAGHDMAGMTMPAQQSKSTAKPKTTSMPRTKATSGKRKSTVRTTKQMPSMHHDSAASVERVTKDAIPMAHDSSGMKGKPGMKHDAAAKHDMPGMQHDSVAHATPGMQHDSAMKHDTAMKYDSTMKHDMPSMQHDMPKMQHDSAKHSMDGMAHDTISGGMKMTMVGALGISMDRMGSGTTWVPEAAPLPAHHSMAGDWGLMLHGFLWAQYDYQRGPRGDKQFGSLNWGMFMADHALSGGRLELRTMLSLDPATVTERGYPELLQTGESYGGQPLRDRQHPHDFFMELAALYERPLAANLGISLYAAPSGEPALGPVAFMHRPSAMDEPMAPLSHHWQDATHVSFGVITAGLFSRSMKLEASVFNGVEPDEHRWDFDFAPFKSYSTRLTVNPNSEWSFTAGYGFLHEPEPLHPGESMRRITASVLHGRRLGTHSQWASSFIYGANIHEGGHYTHSFLAESETILERNHTFFGRAELVQKTAEDLVLPVFSAERAFNVAAFSAGYVTDIARNNTIDLGLGLRGTVNVVPQALQSAYGSRTPVGGMIFLRLRPMHAPLHDVDVHDGMQM